MKTRLLYIVFFLFLSKTFNAQSLNSLIEESELLVKKTENKLIFPTQEATNYFTQIQPTIDKNRNLNLLEIDLKELEKSSYKKDIGLAFKFNANHNFRNAIDEETNNYVRTSARVELEWNVFKMGFFYNRIKSKRLQNDIEILKGKSKLVEKELWRRQFRIDYNYIINKEAIAFYNKFLSFENEYFDFLNKLYFQKLIKRERLIKASKQIHVLETQIKTVKKENITLKDSVSKIYKNTTKLPLLVVQLDSFSLMKSSQKNIFKEDNIRLQHNALNDINLSFYANQNFIESSSVQRYFPSVGIRFKAPIRFNNRKKIIDTKIKILKAQETDKSLGKFNLTITYVNEYNEKLKDLRNQYKSWQIIEERIRILKVLKQEINPEKTGVLILELMEEQFKVLENVLQLKRQLYKVITRLYILNDAKDINTFFQPFNFKKSLNLNQLIVKKDKEFSIDFQIQFLKAKNIQQVIILKGENDLKKQLKTASILVKEVEETNYKTVVKLIKEEIYRIKK